MRLKRIELAGFKSFVDPTKIDLDRGITAIVGPNGCGKSNIVDALRWVLGEHSAKHLRGGVMDDLIFQGSETRPPVAICDVELTFAVSRGSLPSPYHEMDEIRVRRRLTREGGSDAFINGKMVRLKDVVDIFLDTGISTRAYAIVEQGSIARMVTARPEERRVIFEEAAGVMKYRARRREAERRMKDTQQNLDRVLDLLEEVRSQCRSLKQQASRAERFKRMQEEFSELQAINFGLRFKALRLHARDIGLQLTAAKKSEAEAARDLAAAERSVSEVRAQSLCHENEAEAVQDKLRQAEQQRADLQQQAERQAGERRLLVERKSGLEARIRESEVHLARVCDEVESLEAKLAEQDDTHLQQRKQLALTEVEAATQYYQQQGRQRDGSLSEYERLRHAAEQAQAQGEKARAALARVQERKQRVLAQQAAVEAELCRNSDVLRQAELALAEATLQRQHSSKALAEAQQQLDSARQLREQSASDLADAEMGVRSLRGSVQELRARTKNQDLSDKVRQSFARQGGLWLDESLHVPEGLEAAVAAALRGRAADVCLPAGADWQEMFRLAGTSPVAMFAGCEQSAKVAAKSLADAVGLDKGHPLYNLFAPVQLVERIIEARRAGVCCVSRDGWRFEPEGWLVPPAGNRTANLLAVQRRLREQEQALIQTEQQLQVAEEVFRQADTRQLALQQAWQQAHLSSTRSESSLHAVTAACERSKSEASALVERQKRLQIDMDEIQDEYQHWQQVNASVSSIDAAELAAAKSRMQAQFDLLGKAELALNQARSRQAQIVQELALFAQARDNMLRDSGRLSHEQMRLREAIARDMQRMQQADAALQTAMAHDDLDRKLSVAAHAVEQLHKAMAEVRQRGHEIQQRQHEFERREREVRQYLQQTGQNRQQIELASAQAATRLQDMEEEILRRCQLQADTLLNRVAAMEIEEDADSLLARVHDLEERLERFGPVNLLAIDEYEQANERELFLAEQAADLESSLATLIDTIARIDRTTRQRFKEVFDQTNAHFKQTFPQLFGGGRAELRLNSDDILDAGVEVIAQPPGKRLQDVTLLSGGEKALTAVALVFSIFKIKPAPFCVLDEVDAPLDDANVGRFGEMVRELSDRVQFLSISHNKITMQMADRLVGVSMPEPGVSRIVAVDMESMPN